MPGGKTTDNPTELDVPDELFRCENCGEIIIDPPTAPTECKCGGDIFRYVHPRRFA